MLLRKQSVLVGMTMSITPTAMPKTTTATAITANVVVTISSNYDGCVGVMTMEKSAKTVPDADVRFATPLTVTGLRKSSFENDWMTTLNPQVSYWTAML
jgi:hypothetical protein